MTFADVFGSFTTSLLLTLLLFEDLEIFKLPTLLQLSFADDCAGAPDCEWIRQRAEKMWRREKAFHGSVGWMVQAKTSLQRIFLASALLVRLLCPVKEHL